VNGLLRAGIAASGDTSPQRKPVKVVAKPLGLKPGYDPDKLNQLVDELDQFVGFFEFNRKGRKMAGKKCP
jgi:hypothetical protein